jgi:O-antigen/teichoic acid export membrane protein
MQMRKDPEPRPGGGRRLASGTLYVFLAEALIFPTGLATAAFLTRVLGPEDYGLLTLAATLAAWFEWTVVSIFARAAVKFIGEADDWRPVATTVVRLYLIAGVLAALAFAALARPAALLLGEPRLQGYLLVYALDLPLFCLSQAHMAVLVGVGEFPSRATAAVGRWIGRLLLMLVLVGMGYSVYGAIAANVGASVVELAIARYCIRPPLLGRSSFAAGRLWGYAVPLFLFAISMRLFDRVDVVAIKALGGTGAQVGLYGAAQNLSLVPLLFGSVLAQILLSTLSSMQRDGRIEASDRLARNGIRVIVVLFPFAAMVAGSAHEIVTLIFGAAFAATAPLLALLIFAGVALAMIQVTSAVLTASARPGLTFATAGPLVLTAVAGHVALIPLFGPIAAAAVTTVCAFVAGAATIVLVGSVRGIAVPLATLARSVVAAALAYVAASGWSTPGPWVMVKLAAVSGLIVAVLAVLGELDASEIALLRATLERKT